MLPTVATVLVMSLFIVDRSSSTLEVGNDQRQMNALEKQSVDGIQKRSTRGSTPSKGPGTVLSRLYSIAKKDKPSKLASNYFNLLL